MSAITKIFGAIISFLTGLLGGVLGIFSKKKKGEFFLEIDPSKDNAAAPNAAVAEAPAKPSKKAAKAKKAKKAKAPKAKVKQSPTPQAAPTPEPAVAAMNQALNMPKPKVATIEPLNIPKFGPRRRPGANMQSFLDMAKTVKS